MVCEASVSQAFVAGLGVTAERTTVASSSQPGELSVVDRKLRLLQRSGLFGGDLKGCRIEQASTVEDLRQAYRLVHDVFLQRGYISRDPSQMRVRIFETTPEISTFVAKVGDRVVAVLSIVEDSPELGLPADGAFKLELDELRRAGKRLCEVTNQAVAEEYRKSAICTELMRCAVAVFLTRDFDEAIAVVSPSHTGFYDLLGFRSVGAERSYSSSIDDPVIALSMDIHQYRKPPAILSAAVGFMRRYATEENHFLCCVREWGRQARQRFLDPLFLKQLFVRERNFLAQFGARELRVLRERWGHETFVEVTSEICLPLWTKRNFYSVVPRNRTLGRQPRHARRRSKGTAVRIRRPRRFRSRSGSSQEGAG